MDNYFYGPQSDLFSFYRMPKVLFQYDRYKYLSAEAKVLYGLLLDRMDLSARNGWIDDRGRVYIIFTIEEVMEKLNCGNKKAVQLLSELESKAKLIERQRQGLGKPNLIYVLNFIDVESKVERHFLKCPDDTSGGVKMTSLEVSKRHGINTDNNHTDNNNTDPILSGCDSDGMRQRTDYENYFRDAIDIETLIRDNPADVETILGILDILVDICCSKRRTIRVCGDDKPIEVVKSRFMKLDREHISYVLDSLKKTTSSVRNIRQYLLTALYNAPSTISPYYQTKVNHDLYVDGCTRSTYSGFRDYSCDPEESL